MKKIIVGLMVALLISGCASVPRGQTFAELSSEINRDWHEINMARINETMSDEEIKQRLELTSAKVKRLMDMPADNSVYGGGGGYVAPVNYFGSYGYFPQPRVPVTCGNIGGFWQCW